MGALTGDGEMRTWVYCRAAQHMLYWSDRAFSTGDRLDPAVFISDSRHLFPDPSSNSNTCPLDGASLYKAGEKIPSTSQSAVNWL